MRKWFGLLFFILLIGCERDGEPLTPTAVSADFTPSATRVVTVGVETAEAPTSTPSLTAVPSETATPRPTITRTPTPIPTEGFVTPTLPPVTEEAGDSAELYRLRTWSDVEAAELVSGMTDYAERIKADWRLYDLYGDMGRREILDSGREFILRFPNSPYRTEVEWHMVDASMYYTVGDLNDLMAKLIEADLNAGVVVLESLDSYLHQHGLLVSLQNSVPNLLGDEREIPLYLIERQTGHNDGGIRRHS